MVFEAFDRQDLVSQVTEALAKAIVEGELPPGSRLNEVRLAQEFQISRAPLREALRRLESQGLIEAHPRRGFFLRKITAAGMVELFDVRFMMERYAGQKVAETITSSQIKDIERQYKAICKAAKNINHNQCIEEDLRFHRLICDLSGSTRLLRLFDQISSEVRFTIAHLPSFHSDLVSLAESHAPLVEALRNRDLVAYDAALQRHLTEARDLLVNTQLRAEASQPTDREGSK